MRVVAAPPQERAGSLHERAAPLWIALYLPDLPLQAAGRGLLVDLPFAVIDGPEERPLILAANAVARASGIHTGMPLGAARALAANLTAWRREVAREGALLHRAALAAMHFWANGARFELRRLHPSVGVSAFPCRSQPANRSRSFPTGQKIYRAANQCLW